MNSNSTCSVLTVIVILGGCENKPTEQSASSALQEFVTSLTPSRGRGQGPALEEMSTASFAAGLEKTRGLLLKLRSIDPALLAGDDLIDWKFAQSILVGREIEQGTTEPWKKDPRIYITFTGISGILNAPGDEAKKIGEIGRAHV